MVTSNAATVDDYIVALPNDRRKAVEAVRKVVRDNLPDGYREGMLFGMIGWYVRSSVSRTRTTGSRSGWRPWPARRNT